MICENCKSELSEGQNFCPFCGHKVYSNTSESLPVPLQIEKSFTIQGRTIKFDKNLCNYNQLYCDFMKKADALVADFRKDYKSMTHTFDTIVEQDLRNAISKYSDAVEYGIAILMNYGVDYIDFDGLLNTIAETYGNPEDSVDYISNGIDSILQHESEVLRDKEISRSNRSYWEGGGFGIKGAIVGSFKAGLLNAGTGIVRGIGDTISDSITDSKFKKAREAFTNSEEVFNCLCNFVNDYSKYVFYTVVKILFDTGKIPAVEFEENILTARVKNYLSLYKKDGSERNYEKVIDVLCECINLNPYISDFYCDLYPLLKEDKPILNEMAAYFYQTNSYIPFINKLSAEAVKKILSIGYNAASDDAIEKLDNAITELKAVQSENPYYNISKTIDTKTAQKELLILEKSQLELINKYCDEFYKTADARNPDSLWKIAESGNVFAEDALVNLYLDTCKQCMTDDGRRDYDKIASILQKVKDRKNSILAMFTVLFAEDEIGNKNLLATVDLLARKNKESDKVYCCIAPVFYIGMQSISRKTPLGKPWTSGISNNTALEYISIAAKHLFPSALSFMAFHYKNSESKTNEFGLSNKEVSEYYARLYDAYGFSK